jgi:hypothetical protein
MHDDVTSEPAVEDVAADVSRSTRLFDCALQQQSLIAVLTADVDEGNVDLQRIRRDEHSLDELVRAPVDEVAVLEAARF